MHAVTKGLRRLVPAIDLLATSPLTRTTETANIISTVYGGSGPVPVSALAPDRAPSAFLRWLFEQATYDIIAAVGHDPSLPNIVGLLLTGQEAPVLLMKKGGACLLTIDGVPRPGAAVLRWALEPAHLRDIGRQ